MMQDFLATAIELQRSGQLGPAVQLYQKILRKKKTMPWRCTCWAWCDISKVTTARRSSLSAVPLL